MFSMWPLDSGEELSLSILPPSVSSQIYAYKYRQVFHILFFIHKGDAGIIHCYKVLPFFNKTQFTYHTIHLFKILWFLVHSHNYAAITTVNFRTLSSLQREACAHYQTFSFLPPLPFP